MQIDRTPVRHRAMPRPAAALPLLPAPSLADRTSIAEFFARFTRDVQLRTKARSMGTYQPRLRSFVAYCQLQGLRYLDELSPVLLVDYQHYLLEVEKLAPQTVDCALGGIVGAALRSAWNQHLMAVNVTTALRQVARKQEKQRRVFTRGEMAAMLRSIRRQRDGWMRVRVIRFYLWSGCRRDQGRFLAWEGVDLEAHKVTLVQQKGDFGPRTIVVSLRLARMLKALRRRADGPYVFGHVSMSGPLGWLREAAIEQGIRGYVKGHHLRDSFISWSLNDPRCRLRVQDVARIVGHRSLDQTMEYLETDWNAVEGRLNTLR